VSLRNLHPNNVCFYFPSSNRELFANAAALKGCSPYFASLLGPDFAEGCKVSPADRTMRVLQFAHGSGMSDGFDDSDKEDSAEERAPQRVGTAKEGNLTCSTLFHEGIVRDFAYKTYEAVLLYLKTGAIEFAPLSSSSATPTTFTLIEESTQKPPLARPIIDSNSLLPSVLPKSVYRLAQLLSLPRLSKLALTVFKEQLTVDNILRKLFTKFSSSFSEVADVVVDFAVEHWKEVKESLVLVQRTETERGKLPSGVALKLMCRLA